MNETKKVLFVIPPCSSIENYRGTKMTSIIPAMTTPYGVLSMISYLRSVAEGDAVFDILDLNIAADRLSLENVDIEALLAEFVAEKLAAFEPDIVGVSALFNTCYGYLGMISETIKEIRPLALTVIGGGLATNLAEKVLREFTRIDAACFAEGEVPMADLLNSADPRELIQSHPSWMTRESLQCGRKPVASFVFDLDKIPVLDYSLIELSRYKGRSLDKRYSASNEKVEMSIHTSRGCPFSCVFCANGKVHGKKIRFMSEDRIAKEVEHLVEDHGLTVLLIEDDHFLADKRRAKQVLRMLAGYNISIEFPNGLAVYSIDEEIGRLLKEAGASTVALAVESGSDYVLKKIINKPHSAKMVKKAANILKENDIVVHAFFVVGLPGEMDEHRRETMRLIEDVGFDWVYFFLAIPIAGSRLFDQCVANDFLINENFGDYIATRANIRAPGVDPATIEGAVYLMNLEANFVRNYNTSAGRLDRAYLYFSRIAQKYPEHAFAHYYAGSAAEKLQYSASLVEQYYGRFRAIIEKEEEWRGHARHFDII